MIYMDNAATTRLSGRALEAMMPYLTEQYANPAGTYSFTHASNAAMEKARKQVADVIGATSAEIFFTSGGTESDNWALKGAAFAHQEKDKHIITTQIEHHAILHTCQWLEAQGAPLRPDDACAMLQPVFEGVAAMHKIGLVHRGICPENIRVMENGRCRLAGYATVGLRTAGSGLHEQLYEGYSAPEQYSTAQFEGRYTDEYSLAAVFYRMVCGQAPVPAAQRMVSDSNPRARTVNSAVPGYVSDVLQMGLRLKPMERIQTVPQLVQALSSKEYTEELGRTMKPETPVGQPEEKAHLLSIKGLLAGILILLAILLVLMVWTMVSHSLPSASSGSVESEPASSEVLEPQNLVPSFIGMDYAQVQNNREYTGMYLFYVTEEYSDTVPAGQIMTQEPAADTVLKAGETIRLVVSKGPQKVEMPTIIGFTQAAAVEMLQSRGLIASCFMVVNDGSYAAGCVVSASEPAGAQVDVGTVITVYIAADPSVEITTPPEEPAATEPTTTPADPETPADGGDPAADPEQETK